MGWPAGNVKAPPEIRVLHIALNISLYLTKDPGHISVNHFDHGTSTFGMHDIQPAGSDGKDSASLGVMVVELVQPVSKLQGVMYRVPFAVDSPKIEPREGDQLDRFLRESILELYEVRVALESGMIQFRGEASASATYKGSLHERSRYNMQLSEKRKAAVVDWMTRRQVPNPKPNLIDAIGDRNGKFGEEDPNLRRCDVVIKGEELTWVVQQLWLANRYLGR